MVLDKDGGSEFRTELGMVVRSNLDATDQAALRAIHNRRDGGRGFQPFLQGRIKRSQEAVMGIPRYIQRPGIPKVIHVENEVASENLIPKALKDYSEALAKYKYAKECLGKAEADVQRVTDGKLPKRFVVGNEYIVVAIDAGNIKIHVQQIDGIFGHPGNPMPATGGRY